MTPLKFASAFTGIGGFEQGFAECGWEPTVLIEINKHCRSILQRQYPNTPLLGDITDVSGADLGHPDLVGGGFPCQDTSIAAPHRAGLRGARSGLYYDFIRLVEEHHRLVDATRPEWVLIENTPGLLKSNDGRDMAAVVGGLEDLGYGWAYRTVDARHLGTPQRRPRVIVVGHRGGDPRVPWAVLGDAPAGGDADPTHPVRRGQGGPRPAGVPAPDEVVVWRKSARPRAALSKGGYETWVRDEIANTLTGFDGGNAARQTHLIHQGGRLRTLTFTEWERLQGFPDGWTEGMPANERYQALGNAIHTGTAAWIARRIDRVRSNLHLIGAP